MLVQQPQRGDTSLKYEASLLINGEWVDGRGNSLSVYDKYTREMIASIHTASGADVDMAVHAATKVFRSTHLSSEQRHELLMRAAELIEQRFAVVIDVMTAETGFPVASNRQDFRRCLQTLREAAALTVQGSGKFDHLAARARFDDGFAFTVQAPVGVVAAITPFSSPLNSVARIVATALAAGNSVVLKPSSFAPVSSSKLCQAFVDAGLPPGWLNLLIGHGDDVGAALVAHRGVRSIAFAGGENAGLSIRKNAALRPMQSETYGVSAAIVCNNATMDLAIKDCIAGAFGRSGQGAGALKRIYLQSDQVQAFSERFATEVSSLKLGDPRSLNTYMGPLIDEEEAMRAEILVREAMAKGATPLTQVHREGTQMRPVVLTNIYPEMRVHTEPPFAPVVTLLPFEELSEAIHAINTAPFSTSASIYTSDIENALCAGRRAEVESFHINSLASGTVESASPPHSGMTIDRLMTISLPE